MKISKKIIKLFLITICILFCIFLKNTNIFFSDNNITKNNKNIILKFNKNKSIKNKNNQLYFYNNKLLKNNYIYITKIWVERNKKNKIKIQKNLVKSFAKNLDKNINIKLSINPENLGVKKIFSYNFGINYKKNLGERIKNCKKLHKNQVKILINPYKISIYNYNYRTIFYTNNNFSKKMLKNLGVKQVYSKKFRKNLVKKFGYKEKYLKNFGFNLKKFGCKDEKNVKIWLKSQKNAEKFRICAEKFGYKAIKFDKNLGVKSENFRKKTIKNYVNAEKIRIYDKILDKNYFNLENNCPKMLKIRKNFHFLRKNWLKNINNSLKINDFLCVKWVYSRKNKDFGRFLNNFKSLLRKLYCKNNNLFTLVNKNIFLNSHKINNNLFLIKNIKQNKTNIKLNKTTSAFENDLYFNLLKNTNNNFNSNQ